MLILKMARLTANALAMAGVADKLLLSVSLEDHLLPLQGNWIYLFALIFFFFYNPMVLALQATFSAQYTMNVKHSSSFQCILQRV